MLSYWQVFKRHGWKIALTNLLGRLAASIAVDAVTTPIALIIMFSLNPAITDPTNPPTSPFSSHEFLVGMGALYVFSFIVALIRESFIQAGTYAIADEAITQDQSRMGTFFTEGFKLTLKTTLVSLLTFVVSLPVLAFIALGVYLCTLGTLGIVAGVVVFMLCLLVGIAIGLAFMHAPVILVVERTTVTKSISQSIQLFRQSFGEVVKTFLGILAISIPYLLLLVIVCAPFIALMVQLPDPSSADPGPTPDLGPFVASLFLFVLGILFLTFIVEPIVIAMTSSLIVYRYHKHLRQYVNPESMAVIVEDIGNTEEIDNVTYVEDAKEVKNKEEA